MTDETARLPGWHATTILMVRKGGKAVIGGDGQVSMGQTVVKSNARIVSWRSLNPRQSMRLREPSSAASRSTNSKRSSSSAPVRRCSIKPAPARQTRRVAVAKRFAIRNRNGG